MVITISYGRFSHTLGSKIGSCDLFSSCYFRSCLPSLITFLYRSPYSRHLKNKTDLNQDSSKYQNCMLLVYYYYYATVVRTQKFPFPNRMNMRLWPKSSRKRPLESKQRLASSFLSALCLVLYISKAIRINWSAAHEHLHGPGPSTQDKVIILWVSHLLHRQLRPASP